MDHRTPPNVTTHLWQLADLQSAFAEAWRDPALAARRQPWALQLLELAAESPAAFRALWPAPRAEGSPAADWRRLGAAALKGAAGSDAQPALRDWLRREPRFRPVLPPALPQRPATPPARLTASQQKAYERLWSWSRLFFSGRGRLGPIQPRTSALLVGASGVGKSHVVRQFAADAGLGYLRLTYGDWLPRGAKQEPCTWDSLRLFLLQHARSVIFIDELDKLSAHLEGGWSTSVRNDIYALLDRTWFDSAPGQGGRAEAELRTKLAQSVYFVAAGTWQDLWRVKGGAKAGLGFGAQAPAAAADMGEEVRAARAIPTELLNRFNGELLFLEPMGRSDFEAVVAAAGLDRQAARAGIAINFDEAVRSGLGMRWVENLACQVFSQLEDRAGLAPTPPDDDGGDNSL